MAAIEARGLARTFSGGVVAVAGIDFDVAEGEIYAFLGPNGAGKTTTVRMLTTLLRPTGGSARGGGVDVVRGAHKGGPSVRVPPHGGARAPLTPREGRVLLRAARPG